MERKDIRKQISQRFIEACDKIMEAKNIKYNSQFAKVLGIHQTIFADIRSGKLQAGTDLISSLLTLFPDIDAKWLLLGDSSAPPFEKIENNAPSEIDIEDLVQKAVEKEVEKKVTEKIEALQQKLLQGFSV
jgi:hypothetical protein